MLSVAIITRAYDAESPYIESFIEHYQARNCNEIHVVVPFGNSSDVLEPLLEKYIGVTIHHCTVRELVNDEAQNFALTCVQGSHILSIDIDEFLDIDNVEQLTTYDYAKLSWVVTPYSSSTVEKESSFLRGFKDLQCKYCVRKEICSSLGIHSARLKSKDVQFKLVDAPLIHYTFRSFSDLVLKCALGNYACYFDSDPLVFFQDLSDVKQLPVKFKMAAFYQLVAESSGEPVKKLFKINYDLENMLLNKIGILEKLHDIEIALIEYKARINLEQLIAEIKRTKEAKAYRRLPHHKIAEIADKTLMGISYDAKSFSRRSVCAFLGLS